MSDQQALQDREKQIATLRELRKRRHEERAERPPRLLRGLDAPAVISKEEIKGLLKAEYQNLYSRPHKKLWQGPFTRYRLANWSDGKT